MTAVMLGQGHTDPQDKCRECAAGYRGQRGQIEPHRVVNAPIEPSGEATHRLGDE